jgi:hypothetical protein
MEVRSFFYAHSTSDSGRESVLGLEKSYFELRSLLKTNVNERFSQQEVIIIIKLFLSIIFNGFPVLSFPVCIVQIFRSPEKQWIEVSLYYRFGMANSSSFHLT